MTHHIERDYSNEIIDKEKQDILEGLWKDVGEKGILVTDIFLEFQIGFSFEDELFVQMTINQNHFPEQICKATRQRLKDAVTRMNLRGYLFGIINESGESIDVFDANDPIG